MQVGRNCIIYYNAYSHLHLVMVDLEVFALRWHISEGPQGNSKRSCYHGKVQQKCQKNLRSRLIVYCQLSRVGCATEKALKRVNYNV
jgi:hypothetical protein